jgi:putative ABC transport system substrate-binding protein
MRRVGYLQAGGSANNWAIDAFKQRLGELGYAEGKNISIDYRSVETNYDGLRGLAAELVARKVDVIVTAGGTPPALAAKNATASIPIVFVAVADPVGQGIVPSLARPGGNVTGLSVQHAETAVKTVQLLMEIVPSSARIGILSNPGNSSLPEVIKDMQAAARKLNVEAIVVNVRGACPTAREQPGDRCRCDADRQLRRTRCLGGEAPPAGNRRNRHLSRQRGARQLWIEPHRQLSPRR